MSRSSASVLPLQPATLHRIVRTNPPTIGDFTSKAALGLVDADADPEIQRLESGLSMYRTSAQARRKARAFPFLGGYIAVVSLNPAESVRVELRTLHRVGRAINALAVCCGGRGGTGLDLGMHFELWHMPSGNLVNTFEHEGDALAVVKRAFEQRGREAGEAYALGTEDRRGRSRQLATGADLLDRALGNDASRRSQ